MGGTIACLLLAAGYGLLLTVYAAGFRRQPAFRLPPGFTAQTRISIIIPARNEGRNIRACLDAILAQDYPMQLVELIVVDDHSEDDTAQQVIRMGAANVQLVALRDFVADRSTLVAFKKMALSAGIARSSGELIITTDADCTAPPRWLACMAALYQQTGAQLIVAPVDFTTDRSLVQVFQSLDFMTMQGITAAAHKLRLGSMANGANLAFTRTAFDAVHGYAGTDHLASGDDYLLMVKIRERFPGGIQYLKAAEAIVRTAPQPDWPSFFAQRIRWASKSGKYKDHRLTAILLLVYLFNLSLLLLLAAGCLQLFYLKLFAALLAWKTLLEVVFLAPVARFFNKRSQLYVFPLLQPLHILYICLAGFLGWKGTFYWKGRKVK